MPSPGFPRARQGQGWKNPEEENPKRTAMRSESTFDLLEEDDFCETNDWSVLTLLCLALGGVLAALLLPFVPGGGVSPMPGGTDIVWLGAAVSGVVFGPLLRRCRFFGEDHRLTLVGGLLLMASACVVNLLVAGVTKEILVGGLVVVSVGALRTGMLSVYAGSVVPSRKRTAGILVVGGGLALTGLLVIAGSVLAGIAGNAAILFGFALFLGMIGFICALEIPAIAQSEKPAGQVSPPLAVLLRETIWRLTVAVSSSRLISWLYRRSSLEVCRAGSTRIASTGISSFVCSGFRGIGGLSTFLMLIVLVMTAWAVRRFASTSAPGAEHGQVKSAGCRWSVFCLR